MFNILKKGGQFQYPPIVEPLNFIALGWSVVLGVFAGITSMCFIGFMHFGKWMSHKSGLDKWPLVSSLIGFERKTQRKKKD